MTQHPSTNSMSYAEEKLLQEMVLDIESRLSLLDLGDGGIARLRKSYCDQLASIKLQLEKGSGAMDVISLTKFAQTGEPT